MKRFYCTICKRIKRVRKYPRSVNPILTTQDGVRLYNDDVNLRVGECTRHSNTVIRRGQRTEKVGA